MPRPAQPLAFSSLTPSRVRFGVLGFACALSMITYLDRVCIARIMPEIHEEFGLSNTQEGFLFSAFTFAYAVFEVPSGWLGGVFGPRKTLIRIVLWWSLFTALSGCVVNFTLDSGYRFHLPWVGIVWDSGYRFHPQWLRIEVPLLLNGFLALLGVRFLFGMGEAGAYPNIALAFHQWFPFAERGRIQGAVWAAGRFAGGVTPYIVAALLVPIVTDGVRTGHQWRHAFWIFGAVGVLWCVAFASWFRDRPEEKEGVNEAELDLIRAEDEQRAQVADRTAPQGHGKVPWLRFVTNGNLWCLCLMYFCAAYGWYFNITWLPRYLTDRLGVSRDAPGYNLMAGAPLLAGSVACLLGGVLTDWFIRRTGNRKWGRRLFGFMGHGICATFFFVAMFCRDPWVFVGAITLATFCNDLTMGPSWAICLDIGKRYSAIVAGCMNTIGNLGGAAAGIAVGLILDAYPGDLESGWRLNFSLFAGVYALATLLWLRIDSTKPVVPEELEVRR